MNTSLIINAILLCAVFIRSNCVEVVDYHAPAHYKYNYEISDSHTGDHKQHWEARDGDHVQGAYSLVDADGSTRVVEYTADPHNGFKAVVKKIMHGLGLH